MNIPNLEADKEDEMQELLESMIGYPISPNPLNLEAISVMVDMGATKEDIRSALEYFASIGKVVYGPAQILGSVLYSIRKRAQERAIKEHEDDKRPWVNVTELRLKGDEYNAGPAQH